MIGCVHIGWDTTADEVTLEISAKNGEQQEEVTVTKDYFQFPFEYWEERMIDGDEKITATVSN